MKLETFKNIYFVGVGGIGMSALARYFNAMGKNVFGYDKTETTLTSTLSDSGIKIHYKEDLSIADKFNPEDTLVVYTPAIPSEHIELKWFFKKDFKILKRSEVLGLITESTICLAIAGTHGKTTSSTILAHILYENNISFSAFLGGISENFQSNLVLNGDKYSVVEADEFDRSFLKLSPDYAAITSMDADHLDIYGTKENLEEAFQLFADKLPSKNNLILKAGLPINGEFFDIDNPTDIYASKVRVENGVFRFSIITAKERVDDVRLPLAGRHNIANTLAATAIAQKIGVSLENVKKSLATFKGIKRRFSVEVKNEKSVYIDDYAHHPTEIKAALNAAKELYPNKKITLVFQPHLFSRTKDFMDEFAEELAKVDQLIVLPIYPARELPIPGINSEALLEKISLKQKEVISEKELLATLKKKNIEVILTLGAGNIANHVAEIKKLLS